MTTFNVTRRAAADAALLDHDFAGMVVADMGGWKSTAPGIEYTRTIFFVNPDSPEGDALKGHFTVMFESETSAKVRDAYAMLNGNLIGELVVATPSPAP